jgi:hypothetical protein
VGKIGAMDEIPEFAPEQEEIVISPEKIETSLKGKALKIKLAALALLEEDMELLTKNIHLLPDLLKESNPAVLDKS